MATLYNTRISDTYPGLIKTIDNLAINATLRELTDGTGNASGLFLNNAGDFKVTAILEFGSLKDTGENIIISKFVDAADGIGNNDNDTTIPTTAAIIDYVAAQITAEDLDFTGDTGSGQIDLDSQIFAIGGTTNEITTVASGQSLTLSLDSTGVNLPNNSTAITQTAGDNSTKVATTSYVDTLDAASDLDFSGDSGTGDVNLNTQTFAVTGTTSQIETTASGQGLSLKFPTAGITLPNGSIATTQSAGDNSTKVATTSYVDTLDAASDLDITDGTNNGDVNLNTQSLSILGTTNEIDSVVSGQSVTLGLPSQINVNVQGNLTGNVTGDVTGDLTGNSAGTHTGAVVGNVTGNVIGNVTGDLTGNADSATKWQTARDLSVSGEATGTISSVDGTSNVSGALTLDNNSVTGKVLTGLTSPSASSVLATDTIVEGFGKLQSQVNGLANGLRFIGSWDADTNSPVLSDGGGESASGTTTGVATNKLIDSNASFTSAVLNDKVVNQVDGQTATVSAVDSGTQLTLSADIMLSGEAYTIDNSPYITQGHYYVVDNGGATELNGINSWSIGDWVIAGANNEWTKLDHSQVDGTGTPTFITKWSANQVIADSIMSESGSTITVAGALTTNTNLSSTGNFAVNTDKFTANATSGNVAFTGDLAINTDKFTVNATSGDTVVAGDLTTTAGYLQLGAVALPSAGVTAITNRSTDNSLYIQTSSGNTAYLLDGSQNTMYSAASTAHNFYISNVPKLTIDSNGDSTFAGDVGIGVTATKALQVSGEALFGNGTDGLLLTYSNGNSSGIIDTGFTSTALEFRTGGSERLTINSSTATFAGNVGIGGTTGTSPNSADRFLKIGKSNLQDCSIILQDAVETWEIYQNDDLQFSFGTTPTTVMTMQRTTGNVGIGCSPDSPLHLAQSAANTFFKMEAYASTQGADAGINVARELTTGSSSNLSFWTNTGSALTQKLTIDSSGNATFVGNVLIGTNINSSIGLQVNQSLGSGNAIGFFRNSASSDGNGLVVDVTNTPSNYLADFRIGNSSKVRIDSDGNVGIGTDSPQERLHIVGLDGSVPLSSYYGSLVVDNNNEAAMSIIGNSYSSIYFGDAATNFVGAINYQHSVNAMIFKTNGNTEKMRIGSNGNIAQANTSPIADPFVNGAEQWMTYQIGKAGVLGAYKNNDESMFGFNTYFSAPSGVNKAIVSGLGGTATRYYADRITFNTLTSSGTTQTQTERMRITSGGETVIGGGASLSQGSLTVAPLGDDGAPVIYFNRANTSADSMSVQFMNDGSIKGSITYNNTSTAFNTSSDYRLKENVVSMTGALDRVSQLKPSRFNFIADADKTVDGFLAHEVQEIVPEAISGEKDAVDEDGNPNYQGIDQSKLVPLLVGAIQELKAEIDDLKNKCNCK